MAQNVTLWGASYSNVPALDVPATGGGTARFADPSITTAVESDVASGKIFLKADGSPGTGTASGGAVLIEDTLDAHGGTIRTITAGVTVSGSQSITQNGTYDISTKASVEVNVPTGGTPRTSSDLTVSGATVTAPAGTYASDASKSVASGTEGTPTATKGTVSNHSVTVTPSVTNAAGYISGGTHSGTAVTVSVSELVSGSETKTANGTYDVTNLASLVVNVAASGGKSGQIQSKVARTSQTAYTDMGFEITVAKTGTYDIYWSGYRSSTSGTSGAQIYVNGTASGNAVTTFDSTYTNCQNGVRSNVSLNANDKVTIRARARNTSSYMYVMNLAIIEV